MSCEKNLTACPKHPECMINSDYLQHRNKMLAKQRFATLPNLRHQPNPSHNGQICSTVTKSVALQPNLWHSGQIFGQAANSVAGPGDKICSTAAKPMDRGQFSKFVAWQPNLRQHGQICGTRTAAKSVAQQPYL